MLFIYGFLGGYLMKNTCSIILAAGDGKRMKSDLPKALSKVLFKPILKWIIDSLQNANVDEICVVCGYRYEKIERYLKNLDNDFTIALQKERLGTAHAITMANEFLRRNLDKDVIILCGDAPFIDYKTIQKSYEFHKISKNAATVISAKSNNPYGYGRIIRNKVTGKLIKIVEQKDADAKINLIDEVNSGAYWFSVKALLDVIYNISDENAQKEFYLTDSIDLLIKNGKSVDAFSIDNEDIIKGANDHVQLHNLNETAREKVLVNLMLSGVNIPFKDGIVISDEVSIGENSIILPNTILKGKTKIGNNCTIGPNVFIDNCEIMDNLTINFAKYFNQKIDSTNILNL